MRKKLLFVIVYVMISSIAFGFSQEKNLRSYVYELKGDTVEDITKTASIRAVKSCTGRFYFQKRSLFARDILDRYLEAHYERFISDFEVFSSERVGAQYHATVRVAVLSRKLEKDLEEKRFFYRPKMHPFSLIFLDLRVDDTEEDASFARDLMHSVLKDRTLRYVNVDGTSPFMRTDISQDAGALRQGLISAQRNFAEILISGSVKSELQGERSLYYDTYIFYETSVVLKLYRAETGELISEATFTAPGAHIDREKAIEKSIRKAVTEGTNRLIDGYYKRWPQEVQPTGDFILMVSNIREEDVQRFVDGFEAKSFFGKASARSFYGEVAVFNVFFDLSKKELLKILSSLDYPHLKIVSDRRESIEAEIVE